MLLSSSANRDHKHDNDNVHFKAAGYMPVSAKTFVREEAKIASLS